MAQNQKSYDNEFKAQAVKLAQEIGGHKSANELGIPKCTMYTWIKAFKEGRLSANEAVHTPKNALCHDNARCESMWARFKEELLYGRYDTTTMTVKQLKTLIWRYFISYWNNRRICSANGGLPPMVKRQQYYASLQEAA